MSKKLVALYATLVVLLGGAAALMFSGAGEAKPQVVQADSGAVACQNMLDRAQAPKSDVQKPPMTETDYRQARAPFESSTSPDVHDAGTAFVDTVYKLVNSDEGTLADSLGGLLALKTRWADLQVACKNHGVVLPDLIA